MKTSTIHKDISPFADKVVALVSSDERINGALYRVEDWWDRLGQGSWTQCAGNFACMQYAVRSGLAGLPIDDEVVYGKIGAFGYLVHVSELGAEVPR